MLNVISDGSASQSQSLENANTVELASILMSFESEPSFALVSVCTKVLSGRTVPVESFTLTVNVSEATDLFGSSLPKLLGGPKAKVVKLGRVMPPFVMLTCAAVPQDT